MPEEAKAYDDGPMQALVEAVRQQAQRVGLRRERGGLVKGVWWCEMAGRVANGSWIELRLHFRPGTIAQAGLLEYLPLERGGRTTVLGESQAGGLTAADSVAMVAKRVQEWLGRLPAVE